MYTFISLFAFLCIYFFRLKVPCTSANESQSQLTRTHFPGSPKKRAQHGAARDARGRQHSKDGRSRREKQKGEAGAEERAPRKQQGSSSNSVRICVMFDFVMLPSFCFSVVLFSCRSDCYHSPFSFCVFVLICSSFCFFSRSHVILFYKNVIVISALQ